MKEVVPPAHYPRNIVMSRCHAVTAFAFVLALFAFTSHSVAQQKDAIKAQPSTKDMWVGMTAEVYEVDEATHLWLTSRKRLSLDDLEALERQFLGQDPPPEAKKKAPDLFELLKKQKPILTTKEIEFDLGREAELVTMVKKINFAASPEQLHSNNHAPQVIPEGVVLRVQVDVTPDRRFVRVKFIEKSTETEGSEKSTVTVGATGDVVAETAFLKQAESTQVRDIPDGGSFALPFQYRPRTSQENGRWLVVKVTPRIHIAAEEKAISEGR